MNLGLGRIPEWSERVIACLRMTRRNIDPDVEMEPDAGCALSMPGLRA